MKINKNYIISQLTVEERFDGYGEYYPFILEGFLNKEDQDLQDLLKEDSDIYIVGTSMGGIELSRHSFWK